MRKNWTAVFLLPTACGFLGSCAQEKVDHSRPTQEARPGLEQRLSESSGYKQTESGEWVPKVDKRSSYDSQRDTPYAKGKIDNNERYKTGDYAKKTWWGSKDYEKKSYQGDTDGSRFYKQARQDDQVSRFDGKAARTSDPFQTNTLPSESAHEIKSSAIDRPKSALIESQRKTYKAPSVIDWREQRSMNVEESKSILGR